MLLEVFTKKDCPKCTPVHELVNILEGYDGITIVKQDTEDVCGLARAAYLGICSVPAIVLTDGDNTVFKEWIDKLPQPLDILWAFDHIKTD